MSETMIPSCSFRWFIDYDGEKILQQRFTTPSGSVLWRAVPTVEYYSERDAAAFSKDTEERKP